MQSNEHAESANYNYSKLMYHSEIESVYNCCTSAVHLNISSAALIQMY